MLLWSQKEAGCAAHNEKYDKSVRSYGLKTEQKREFWKFRCRWGDNIKMDLKERVYENGTCVLLA